MIGRRTFALAALAALAGCAAPGKAPEGPAAVPGAPAFELRLASSNRAKLREGWTEMPVRGDTKGSILVSPRALLRAEDVDNAALSKGDSPALILSVRPSARELLTAETQAHLYNENTNPDEWIVMMLDGNVVYIARLGLPLHKQVSVRIGREALTKAEADRCIEVVRAQRSR